MQKSRVVKTLTAVETLLTEYMVASYYSVNRDVIRTVRNNSEECERLLDEVQDLLEDLKNMV